MTTQRHWETPREDQVATEADWSNPTARQRTPVTVGHQQKLREKQGDPFPEIPGVTKSANSLILDFSAP